VREEPEHQPEGCTGRAVEPEHRVGGEPREHAARLRPAEGQAGEQRRRQRRPRAEAGQRERVGGKVQRGEQVLEQRLGIAGERLEDVPPPAVVLTETACGRSRRALEEGRGAIVERVGERRRRLDPLDAVLGERQRAEERRRDPERVDRRTDVVDESRQRQLGRACAAPHRVGGLEDANVEPRLRQHDRRGEPVRT
jgi:hypothetical protein